MSLSKGPTSFWEEEVKGFDKLSPNGLRGWDGGAEGGYVRQFSWRPPIPSPGLFQRREAEKGVAGAGGGGFIGAALGFLQRG